MDNVTGDMMTRNKVQLRALVADDKSSPRTTEEKVGKSKAQKCFYVDRLPGEYEISTATEIKRTLSVMLEKGHTYYVRMKVTMGFAVGHVTPELVDPSTAEHEMQKCRLTTASD